MSAELTKTHRPGKSLQYSMFKFFQFASVLIVLAGMAIPSFSSDFLAASERFEAPNRWRTGNIQIAVSSSMLRSVSNIKSDSDVASALRRSIRAWESVANVHFQISVTDELNVSDAGVSGDGINLLTVAPSSANALLFAKNPDAVAATTRVFYDAKGFISEADIVLNPYQQFSTDGTFGTYDLESTLTHELGHLLGLDHSPVLGSTMHENYGKNGIFGVRSFGPRTIAELDKAAIRAKYGEQVGQADECCGTISGKLSDTGQRAIDTLRVWAEDADTGQVKAETSTNSLGAFEIGGLTAGTYKLYSQRGRRGKSTFSPQRFGEVTVESGQVSQLSRRLKPSADDIDVNYLGFNGQLSGLAVPINPGRSYTVYVGGKNLDFRNVSLSFSSPYLTIVPDTIAARDYGDELSVLSFEVKADPDTPIGEYSIFADSATGGRSVVVGGIIVRRFVNPYSNFIVSN